MTQLINTQLEELEEPLRALSKVSQTAKSSLGEVIQDKCMKLNQKISRVYSQIKMVFFMNL